MKLKHLFYCMCLLLFVSSCNTTEEVPYLINADQLSADVLKTAARANDPVLQPGDMLQINVSGTNAESVKPFNRNEYINESRNSSMNLSSASMYYYLVDNNGYIDFPILGKLQVAGMTKSATENFIAAQIYPKYLTERPGVELRITNFRVYTIGEVSKPGMVESQNGRMNILEAIALSGDLTIHGMRENIMIIRTKADGGREIIRTNINDPNLVLSPNFNLQQNDVIYVQPNASKARSSWSVPPGLSLGMSSVGTLISIATFIITLSK